VQLRHSIPSHTRYCCKIRNNRFGIREIQL